MRLTRRRYLNQAALLVLQYAPQFFPVTPFAVLLSRTLKFNLSPFLPDPSGSVQQFVSIGFNVVPLINLLWFVFHRHLIAQHRSDGFTCLELGPGGIVGRRASAGTRLVLSGPNLV